MATNAALVQEYVEKILPLLDLAKKAYGSRDTVSPQHNASREYTRLLVEFYEEKHGSLLDLAKALNVAYPGLRRRVTTADLPASSGRKRPHFSDDEYTKIVEHIQHEKALSTLNYHEALHKAHEEGYSLARIATMMGLSSANPLYYGVSRVNLYRKSRT